MQRDEHVGRWHARRAEIRMNAAVQALLPLVRSPRAQEHFHEDEVSRHRGGRLGTIVLQDDLGSIVDRNVEAFHKRQVDRIEEPAFVDY
jgi:hypothetical protein